MPRPDIIYRILLLIRAVTDDRRRSKELEEQTGIADRHWKNVWALKQRPTAQMIEALARRWPEYAFWLATGITDIPNGHLKPGQRQTTGSSPEIDAQIQRELELSQDYFELELLLQELGSRNRGAPAVNDSNRAQVEELGELLQAVTSDVPTGQEEELWVRYLALLNKQDESKDLDQAIARIAKEKRLRGLAEKFGIDLSSPAASIEVVMAYFRVHGKRNSGKSSRLKEAVNKDVKPR
ncbi:hypothetical protein [Paraburkholderia ferrariae]|uniref:XRE family transcriptional regulator n=1 Tax=Paraburkholderia ferrariae TaxID=386056 RepID=A0ABU9S1C3_9BURK